jgi:putative tricarboxylic transport membrane protein
MLLGIAACTTLLLLRNVYRHVRRSGSSPTASVPGDEFDNRKAALGIVLLIVYSVTIPVIGFTLATIGFLLVWLPYGGVRRPAVVVSVALIGTAALLYTFVKLTTLPLDRGTGMFNGLTVSLYRLLGIY